MVFFVFFSPRRQSEYAERLTTLWLVQSAALSDQVCRIHLEVGGGWRCVCVCVCLCVCVCVRGGGCAEVWQAVILMVEACAETAGSREMRPSGGAGPLVPAAA